MTDDSGRPLKLVVDKSKHLYVHYLQTLGIDIGIKNEHPNSTVVIDSLGLRFQSRMSPGSTNADPHTTVVQLGRALSIPSGNLDYCAVQVRPNLLFLKATNVFDVAVSYRLSEKLGEIKSFIVSVL